MDKRYPFLVFLLSAILMPIYPLYWQVSTKREMYERGEDIPSAWLLLIPFVSFYFDWKYSCAVHSVSRGRLSALSVFLLLELRGIVALITIVIIVLNSTPTYNYPENRIYYWIPATAGAIATAFLQFVFNGVQPREPAEPEAPQDLSAW